MTPTHNGHAPESTRPDPGDQARCPMERLADRMADCPRPKGLSVYAYRHLSGWVYYELKGELKTPEDLEELINFLARVKG
jgi:hypothetical protein